MWYHAGGGHADEAARVVDSLAINPTPAQLEVLAWQLRAHTAQTRAPMRWINEALRQENTSARLNTKAYFRLLDKKPDEAEMLAREAQKNARARKEDTALHDALLLFLKER